MAKKQKNNKLLFGFFIIFIMVSSTIGFMYSSESDVKNVNGVKFFNNNGLWRTYIESIESHWDFNYLPNELGFNVDNINFNKQIVYVYANSPADEKYVSKLKFILLYRGINVEQLEEKDCSQDLFVINSELTQDVEISYEDKCVLINGNINKFIDGVTYKIFGVL